MDTSGPGDGGRSIDSLGGAGRLPLRRPPMGAVPEYSRRGTDTRTQMADEASGRANRKRAQFGGGLHPLVKRARLGGLLNYYYRDAA